MWTRPALLVRCQVELEEGDWSKTEQAMIGRMVATKLGMTVDELSVGRSITLEGRTWEISGVFPVGESEVWCRGAAVGVIVAGIAPQTKIVPALRKA